VAVIQEAGVDEDPIHVAVSNDGTKIAGRVQGQGPPLVLVHGGLGDGDASWLFMLPFLVGHFACYPMSTRGRGLSDDNADHSRERQFEDVAAYLESIDEPAWVFGHSSGALWALGGAALASARVRALALYEPPFPALDPPMNDEQYARVRAAVTESRQAAATLLLGEIIGLDDDEQALFSAPGVAERVHGNLPVVVKELPEVNRPFDDALLETLTMPVLILQGARSRIEFKIAARRLTERLEDARVTEVAGAGHIGPLTAAEGVADELVRFFRT
jgi:pimeloyl-ACP methyl ester carboxylesterase